MYRLRPSAYSVSNAKEDLPDPDIPVTTTSLFFGNDTSIFLRLCTLAPLISAWDVGLFSVFKVIKLRDSEEVQHRSTDCHKNNEYVAQPIILKSILCYIKKNVLLWIVNH